MKKLQPQRQTELDANQEIINFLLYLEQKQRALPLQVDEINWDLVNYFQNEIKYYTHKQISLVTEEFEELKFNYLTTTANTEENLYKHLLELKELALLKVKYQMTTLENAIFLGSCQYTPIEHYYDMYRSLYDAMYSPETVEDKLKRLFKLLELPTEGLTFLTEAEQIQNLNEFLSEEKTLDGEPFETIDSIEEYYGTIREEAWDLWSAYILNIEYSNEDYSTFNDKLDPESEMIGLCILMHQVLYGTSLSTFGDFDT